MLGQPVRVGPYRVVRRLGAGGMGVVYLGYDDAGAAAAVKLIKPEHVADPTFRARLRREVDAARRVPRFCTAPVLAADLDAEAPWVATEFIDGPSLDVILLEQQRLAGAELEALAAGVAGALRAVHAQGVVHRDLKPSNILLSPMGPRVIDFGIARVDAGSQLTALTAAGAVVGTPSYMAPEQLRGEPLTAAVDVFAWASVVAQAATGRLPFGSGPGAAHGILREEPDLRELTEPLRSLVAAAFNKDPAARPSAAELVDRISRGGESVTQVLADAVAPPAAVAGAAAPPAIDPVGSAAPPPTVDAYPAAGQSTVLGGHQSLPPAGGPAAALPRTRHRRWRLAVAVTAPVVVAALVVTTAVWLSSSDPPADPRPGDAAGLGHDRGAVPGERGEPPPFGSEIQRLTDSDSGLFELMAVAELDGRPAVVSVVVSAGDSGPIRVRDLATGEPIINPLTRPDRLTVETVAELDGRPIIVSGGLETIWVWDMATGDPISDPIDVPYSVDAVAVSELDGRPVVVSGLGDRTLRVWDLVTGEPVGTPITHAQEIVEVAVSELDGRPVVVVVEWTPHTIRVWDLATGDPIGDPITDHDDQIFDVAVGELNGRPLVVSGSHDSLRVWDLATGEPVGDPMVGHDLGVYAVAVGELNGRPLVVSGGGDRTVQVWDLATGEPIGEQITHPQSVWAVAVAELNGHPVAVSGSDGTIRVWSIADP